MFIIEARGFERRRTADFSILVGQEYNPRALFKGIAFITSWISSGKTVPHIKESEYFRFGKYCEKRPEFYKLVDGLQRQNAC